MKQGIIWLLLWKCMMVYAQTGLTFKPLRYEEDYSFLEKDSIRKGLLSIKYIPFSKSNISYVSLGGEARYQYFYVRNEDWGEIPADTDGYVLNRYLVHADIHAGKYLRTFLQLQSSLANSRQNPSPVDENPLDLHQAFLDVRVFPGTHDKIIFRIGRHELLYGSQRLISVREGPNNRQSFDGVKAVYVSHIGKLDLFYSQYVAPRKGIFDDRFHQNIKLWGGYFVKNQISLLQNIDLYYLGLWKKEAAFDDGKAEELRHTVGSRLWGISGNWRYDAEGVFQFGNFGSQSISAWTVSLNTGYTWDTFTFKPEIGLKTELISGDKVYKDNKLNTFNPLFPKGVYFGLAALIGPANLIDLHPSLHLSLHKNLSWDIDYDAFWRYSLNDGLYAVNASLIYSGKNIPNRFIGHQFSTNLEYTPSDFLYLRSEFTWFHTGHFLNKAGTGKDILFSAITAHLKF